jgi:hypothetical protein
MLENDADPTPPFRRYPTMTRQRRAPNPAVLGPFSNRLFSHLLWLLSLLTVAGSVLVGCGSDQKR